jgi:hypothetical protein
VAWDSSRPVPWRRLLKEWALYAALMAALFLLFFRDSSIVGILLGLLASGPLYLAFGYVMAKIGYQRQTLRQARSSAAARRGASGATGATADPVPVRRPKPAPTKRTSGGSRPRR